MDEAARSDRTDLPGAEETRRGRRTDLLRERAGIVADGAEHV